ncbi:MAG: hypothetical protein O7H41_18280 [Planctomycetota bacterium]|nr:hypothetical protein [Planctomycetota bacterium]
MKLIISFSLVLIPVMLIPFAEGDDGDKSKETITLKLAPESYLAKPKAGGKVSGRPRWSPKNGKILLEEQAEGYGGVLPFGPAGRITNLQVRRSKAGVIDTLLVDLDGNGKFKRREVFSGQPGKDSQGLLGLSLAVTVSGSEDHPRLPDMDHVPTTR